ncbi:UTP--glucose-1-phosphate uridylyltransferase GalU [Candidatus Microgenomates bacterium]|nr:UTP--glucose-1-phosphate uridylyltransferase GalU [Candidatus Microgenomates bacterium]
MPIRKCVIPVAGFGTRFLPATKAQPKEMLPIVDKPILQYIVEEAVASGITDIILVTSSMKRSVEDHFDYSKDVEQWLETKGQKEMLAEVRKIAQMANFVYVRQKGSPGNGAAVLCAKSIIGDEPFAVAFGDDLFVGEKPRLKQLIEVFNQYQNPVLTGYTVEKADTEKYGMLEADKITGNIYQVKSVVEKPGPEKTPSLLAAPSGYILTPDIFDEIENLKPGKGGEKWLTDAINNLVKKRPVYACQIEGKYYDTGSKIGWLKANIELGLKHPETKDELKKYLSNLK